MKSKSPLLPLARLLIALPTSIGVAVGQQAKSANLSYEVINLGTPLGGTLAAVQTISLQGFLAGYANLPDNAQHAILFELSGTKDLGTLGGQNSAILVGVFRLFRDGHLRPVGAGLLRNRHSSRLPGVYVGEPQPGCCAAHAGGHVRGSLWHERSWSGGRNLVGPVFTNPSCLVGGEPQAPFDQVRRSVPADLAVGCGRRRELATLPGDSDGSANAINNLGQITGSTGTAMPIRVLTPCSGNTAR